MLNQKNISDLAVILANVETQGDLETLYRALEPLQIGVSYYTDWRDTKISNIWNTANKFRKANIEHGAMQKTWNAAKGNFTTFKTLSDAYFAENGTKEQRILELIQKLLDKNWYQGKEATAAIEKAKEKNWIIKESGESDRPNVYVFDLTKSLRLRGMTNSMEIEELQRLLEVEVVKIPYYGEWSIRDKAGETKNYKIFLNGNIILKNEEFRVALIPFIEKWAQNQWNTLCYKI